GLPGWLRRSSIAVFRFSCSGCGPTIMRLMGNLSTEEEILPSEKGEVIPSNRLMYRLVGLEPLDRIGFLFKESLWWFIPATILNSFSSLNPQCLYREAASTNG